MTTTTDTPALASWQAWRAARERALHADPHGWLTLIGLHWLDATPRSLAGIPGQWWADDDGAHVRAEATEGLRRGLDGERLDGELVESLPEAGSTILASFAADREFRANDATVTDEAAHSDQVPAVGETADGDQVPAVGETPDAEGRIALELALRTGRYVVRVRDPRAPTRRDFAGVPTHDYDPDWDLDVRVRWYAAPRPEVVGGAQPGLEHHVEVVGEVELEREGVLITLRLTAGHGNGDAALLFSDTTDDTAPWRILAVPRPAGAEPGTTGRLRLDLNRTINLPFAFSDFGTCPRPVAGNDVPFAVTAGEKVPR